MDVAKRNTPGHKSLKTFVLMKHILLKLDLRKEIVKVFFLAENIYRSEVILRALLNVADLYCKMNLCRFQTLTIKLDN